METREKKEKEKIDFKKYQPIQTTEVVDDILKEMEEKKIFPSVGLQNVALMFAKRKNVQFYIVEKFTSIREKILSDIERNKQAEKKRKGEFTKRVTDEHQEALKRAMENPDEEFQPWTRHEKKLVEEARKKIKK